MNICLYTTTAFPALGGQEVVVDALARQFTQLGHAAVVFAPKPREPQPSFAAIPYRVERHPRFVSTRRFVAWYRRWLMGLQRQHCFAIIHCHGIYPAGYLAGLCHDQLRAPVVITSHGDDLYPAGSRLAKPAVRQRHVEALRTADAVVSISRYTREGYRQLYPNIKQIVDIPNGIDGESLAISVTRPADLDPAIKEGAYILFLGRLIRRKGVDILLRALALLPQADGVQLVIAGDGRERAVLETLALQFDLMDRVRFVGRTTGDMKTYLLQNAACMAVPSRNWEAFGLVVLESFSAGRPVIASRLPGLGDLVSPGHTGWLIEPENPLQLAAAMRDALSDPTRIHRYGQQAARFAQDFSWRRVARQHLQLYERLRSNSAAPGPPFEDVRPAA